MACTAVYIWELNISPAAHGWKTSKNVSLTFNLRFWCVGRFQQPRLHGSELAADVSLTWRRRDGCHDVSGWKWAPIAAAVLEDAFHVQFSPDGGDGSFLKKGLWRVGEREKSDWGRCSEVLATTCEERDRGVKGGVASEMETDIDFVLFFSFSQNEPSPTQSLDFSFECFSLNQKAPLLMG